MSLNLNSLLIGSANPSVLIKFYTKILAKKPDMEDGDWGGWLVGKSFLSVGPHSEVKGKNKEPGRFLFNFETEDVRGEFDRMVKEGAKVIKEPYEMGGMWIGTLADPDGNYFQVMSPWKDEK
jgi:predicted enzyme related to lactoylglutathione lyase